MQATDSYSLHERYQTEQSLCLSASTQQKAENNSRYTVLVIDDDQAICDLMQIYLKSLGFQVILAKNGDDALACIQAYTPDLIFLDICLPTQDGFTVCKAIRQEYEIPILMLTAANQLDYAARAFQLGADGYITKPFALNTLKIRIQALLNDRPRLLNAA